MCVKNSKTIALQKIELGSVDYKKYRGRKWEGVGILYSKILL